MGVCRLNSEMTFQLKNKLDVDSLSSYCDVINYDEGQDRLVVEVQNLKFRFSELSEMFSGRCN